MACEPRRATGSRLWAVVALALWPAVAFGQGADELASTIEQSLAGIEFRLDLRPSQAAQDLEAQKRRLVLLEQQAPDYPGLPALRQKFAELEAGLEVAEKEAANGVGAASVPTAPEGFTAGLHEVDALQKQAETSLLLARPAEAAGFLAQAEQRMAGLEARYGNAIPQGHAPLIVTKEKLAALKDQLADVKSPE